MIEIITPAESTRLTTLDAVKADLGISGSASDGALEALIDQFSDTIAAWCRRTFGAETVRETVSLGRLDNRSEYSLERWPAESITSVSVAGAALTPDQFYADLSIGTLFRRGETSGFCSWPVGGMVVTYTTGYVLPDEAERTLPHDVERACILMVRSAWRGMARDPSLRSEENAGVATFTYFASNGDALSLEAQALLSPYRIISVG